MTARLLRLLPLLIALGLGACDPDPVEPDAGPEPDTGPPVPSSLAHCETTEVPETGGTGGMVESGSLEAGVAEIAMDVPLGATLGAYTGRSEGTGREGFLPAPDERRTRLGESFAPSVGIETIPRIKVLALRAGGETVLLIKIDLASSYQGFVHDLEAELGATFSGKVIIASSHSHSSFGNYSGHGALAVGFGQFRQTVYDMMLAQLVSTSQAAIDNLQPARIGFALNDGFDPDDRVNRDRRPENDDLAGGSQDDDDLYMVRVDAMDGTPMAMIPVFGIHGTVHGGRNVLASTDSIGGLERVLEESFDENVMVMHLQGAGGDVSPAGMGVVDCTDRSFCHDYGRPETIGLAAVDEIRAAYDAAGEDMEEELALEMITRTVPLGPDWTTFTVRDGELEYAPWDGTTESDGRIFADDGSVLSPIDEFNAPFGAALCGTGDLGFRIPRSSLAGSQNPDLRDSAYFFCNRIENATRIIELTVGVELGEAPVCGTTQTTLTALRMGDWMLATLPGEPTTLLVDHLREISPMPAAQTIVVGYAQDHGGYLLRPEDWLSGGYEPSITFWGPLEGEYVAEQSAALMNAAMTPERENGNEAGIDRIATPMVDDGIPLDNAQDVGTVPAALPEYLLTRLFNRPPSVQPATSVERIQTVYFTFIGDDPIRGTPRITLQRETEDPGVYEDVLRSSGRPVMDGDLLLTWTPNPIFREEGTPRTHYYTVEFQAAAPMGMPDLEAVQDRVGLPLGNYRFRVEAPTYELTSDPFEVTPATLIANSSASGADLSVTLGVENANGFRLLDRQVRSNLLVPLRSAAIMVAVDGADATEITTDADGTLTVPGAASASSVVLTDRFGNTATVTP
ncbi:MAG: neutral/alkaline non-lysosomal ceramidase N-terminal domain-containing protein [Sandaracinaceae bacterium]